MTINNVTLPNFVDTSATGRSTTNPFVVAFQSRDPTVLDTSYPQQKIWLNTSTDNFWFLKTFNTVATGGVVQAVWIPWSSTAVVETLTGNDGIVVPPTANNINVVGDGTLVTTSGNAGTSTLTINVNSGAIIANGLKVNVDAHTAPGTNPVVPDSTGHITVTGGQVAAGTTTNVIRTDSLAANTYTVEIQRSQAVGSSTVGDNGVSHFDSASFLVDANGFVQMNPDMPYYSLTPYIVGTDVHSQYSTIASAIAQAVADGASSTNPKNIYIKPKNGGYTENLTVSDGINLNAFGEKTVIKGKVTMTGAGLASLNNLHLQTNSDFAVSVTGSSASVLSLTNCEVHCPDHTGIEYTSSSSSAFIKFYLCDVYLETIGIAYYTMSSPGDMSFYYCYLANSGLSTTATTQSAGAINMYYTHIDGAIANSGTGGIGLFSCTINPGAVPLNVTALTCNGTGANVSTHGVFSSGTESAISIGTGAQLQLTYAILTSSNTNVLTGAGTLAYAFLSFASSSGHNVTTETALATL